MARIIKSESNIVNIPFNVSVNAKGYVYINTSSSWVAKVNGSGKHADHEKVCIGKALIPGTDWKNDRRMYANATYYTMYPSDSSSQKRSGTAYDEYPVRSDCLSVGLYAALKKLAAESGLTDILADVFGSENTWLILDLAMYMVSSESAVFQHFPHWAGSSVIFSDTIRSDSYISHFEKEDISLSKINLFKKKWAGNVLDDGRIFVCYDSTNVNSQAEGVFIVQKGHAKDDADKDQINTEYAIRQKDGMPITYKDYPGSINDMAEASDMILFFRDLLEGEKASSIVMIADRGYVSEDNIAALRKAGIGYILLLRKNMNIRGELLDEYVNFVKKPSNYMEATGKFALTVHRKLFESDTEDSWFHIVWDANLEISHRFTLMRDISAKEKKLQKAKERKTRFTDEELRPYRQYFSISCHEEGTLKVNTRGRGAGKQKEARSYVIDSFDKDEESIEKENSRCGYLVYVTDQEMTAEEAMEAVSKRDCVEKAFRALKSWMGMDKYGVHFESTIHAKSLIWFVASILHALLFARTEKIRVKDKKRGTLPAIVDQLEEIRADRNLESGKYERRYKPTKMQKTCLGLLSVSIDEIDEIIADIR